MIAPRVVAMSLLLALAGCGHEAAAPVVETVTAGPLLLSVHGDGELKSAKSTPLMVPGSQWAERQLAWALPEGSPVRKGELIARFSAEQGKLELAQAMVDLERNALARAGKEGDLATGRGRVAVDLSQVGTQLGIARRYADADIDTIARNEVLDAVQDVRFLGTKQDTLQWRQGQLGHRGGAELAVLDAQRATYTINAKRRQDDLDALELRAPHDGVLMLAANWTGDKPQVGSSLRAGFEFGSLPDVSAMEVELSLPQLEAQGLKAGDTVLLAPVGRPGQAITTKLSWVASGAKVRSRQSPVKYVSMKAPVPATAVRDFRLVPGQRMRAQVQLFKAASALSVPNIAISSEDGKSFVQVLAGRELQRREVVLGARGTARSQVLKGLRVGETVLLTRMNDDEDKAEAVDAATQDQKKDEA
ncbi:efflux RND transporter periplasmic adaptor subunit [Aerolutibacter ruishenii]|uniref:Multidrug efflux pump subunit AcrA (Membrane-fusion protein) n=1 Tax=Aerolutibacter ruishenii TaxID=686800 RepID=A0A562LJZ7_9GAMM|nr:hypothetical protein [Lysobacter ruishenii]TWI07954.1 hypothetical protein IP93_02561 [Lysobacter ruishenii]